MDIMTTLFDEEDVMRRYINNTVNEAVNEAVETMAKKMLARGKMSYEEISEDTGLSVAKIECLDTLQTV